MVFPVVIYGCESRIIKKAECQRIDAFEPVVLEKTFEDFCKSILKEINPEYSSEGLMLKLQYTGYLILRANSLEKILMLRKIEGRRKRGQQRMRWLDGITDSRHEFEKAPGDSEGQGNLACCSTQGHKELDTT